MTPIFAFLGLGPTEIIVVAIVGVLLFGRKLPEMGRYMGKSIVEFKKGMKGLEDGLDTNHDNMSSGSSAARREPVEQIRAPQRVAASAPKFEDTPSSSQGNQPQA